MGPVRARCFDLSDGSDTSAALKLFQLFRTSVIVSIMMIRFKPDRVICGRLGLLLWLASLIARFRGSLFVFSSHNDMHLSRTTSLKKLEMHLNNFFIKRATGAICNGPFLRQQLLDIGLKSEKVFEFGARYDDFLENARSLNSDESQFDLPGRFLLFVGRVEMNKGVFDLLEAFCKAAFPDLSLVFAGDGASLASLRQTIEEKEAKSRVLCLGRVPHEALAAIMHEALAVVTPTRSVFPEGRPKVVMEALAVGTPVIAPKFGTFPYLIQHRENGLLYHADNVDALSSAIALLATDKDLHQSLKSRIRRSNKNEEPARSFFQAAEQAFNRQI